MTASRLPALRRLSLEMLWLGLGQGAAMAGSFVSLPLLTLALSPASYGEVTLSLTVAILTNQIVMGPLIIASMRFFAPAQEAEELPAYLKALGRLLIQGTLLLLPVVCLCGVLLLILGFVKWIPLLLVAFVFSLFFNYNSVLDGIQNAARERGVVAWHQGIGPWLRLILALSFIHLFEGGFREKALLQWSSTLVMAGYATGSALLLISQLYFFRRKILCLVLSQETPARQEIESWTRQIRIYAWPFASWGVFSWIQQSSDRWALQTQGGIVDVGLYGPLYQLGFAPFTQLSAFGVQLFLPIIFRRAGDGSDPERMRRSQGLSYALFWGALIITAIGALVAFLFHKEICAWLIAPEYRVVSPLLPAMVLAGGLFAAAQIVILVLLSGVTSQILIKPKIGTAILATIFNFMGAYWLGLTGLVFASVLSSLIYLAWVLVLVRTARNRSAATVNRS